MRIQKLKQYENIPIYGNYVPLLIVGMEWSADIDHSVFLLLVSSERDFGCASDDGLAFLEDNLQSKSA